ncbi:hypothetical protein [Cellulomonas sp.]|uniref:hypothetical protein n=1 Tax=Cellulomonas sp. TaxID=40001 RepID=UPI003BAA8454
MTTSGDQPIAAVVAPWTYGWWALVGALIGIGVTGLLTLGIVLLALGLILLVIGTVAPALRNRSALGVVGGLAVAPLYLAWLNRAGPGRACTAVGPVTSCTEQSSPWPYVVVALVLATASAILVRRSSR